jgi:hypothetical protein
MERAGDAGAGGAAPLAGGLNARSTGSALSPRHFARALHNGDERVPFRRTFEKRDPGLKLTLELQLDEGRWFEVAEESCTRAH